MSNLAIGAIGATVGVFITAATVTVPSNININPMFQSEMEPVVLELSTAVNKLTNSMGSEFPRSRSIIEIDRHINNLNTLIIDIGIYTKELNKK